MTRRATAVHDMEIDEISLVDRPANQHAAVVIAKRANQEDSVPQYFDAEGDPVDEADLTIGDVVADAEGNLFQFTDEAPEAEPGEVAKSDRRSADAFLGSGAKKVAKSAVAKSAGTGKSFEDQIREELSKALTEDDRDAVISKALGRISEQDGQIQEFAEIAKSERNLRLEREYISKAADYNVPIEADELGPVLMRCAESLSYEDCAVIHKALSSAGEMLFTEVGYSGNSNSDPFEQVEAYLEEQSGTVAKAAGAQPVSKAAAITEFFDNDPDAYDAYRAGNL